MSTKDYRELKNLTKDELKVKIRESEGELFQIRMKKATNQLKDTAAIWRLRKKMARMKMLLSQPAVSQ